MFDWVLQHARLKPDSPAVDSPRLRVTYAELASRSLVLSAALRELGVQPGDRVVSALPAVPAAVAVTCAVQHAGAVGVEVHREWTAEQLAAVLRQTEPRCVAIAARDAGKWRPILAEARVPAVVLVHGATVAPGEAEAFGTASWAIDEGGASCAAAALVEAGARRRSRDDLAVLLYTSGTAGRPRAVMQTFGNIEHNTRAIVATLGLTAQDRAMLVLPLSYCYGRSVLQTHLLLGGSVFLESRTLYPAVVLDAIRSERCTGLAGVPLTFELLRRQTKPDPRSMPSLRYLTQAGGAMAPETTAWVRETFRPARLFQMYGQTEATARLTCLPPDRAEDKRGSVGVALPGLDIRVVDDDGRVLPTGSVGNVVARGPSITRGYYGAPEDTARVLRDGWLWTGDVGRLDHEGFVFLLGRAKEILKLGGHRVAPAEIESALMRHPAVLEAAVASVVDPVAGEAAAALIVRAPGSDVGETELRKHCAAQLPHYMVPRAIRFASSLPRNAAGKVEGALVSAALQPGV